MGSMCVNHTPAAPAATTTTMAVARTNQGNCADCRKRGFGMGIHVDLCFQLDAARWGLAGGTQPVSGLNVGRGCGLSKNWLSPARAGPPEGRPPPDSYWPTASGSSATGQAV